MRDEKYEIKSVHEEFVHISYTSHVVFEWLQAL